MLRLLSIENLAVVTDRRTLIRRVIPFAVLIAGVAVIASTWLFRDFIFSLRIVGYPGVFFLSFLGSVTVFLPVPGLLSVCGVSLVLNPFAVGILAALGESLGEISGYAVGYGGGTVVENRGIYPKLKQWMERRGFLAILLVSTVPNPFFDLVGVAAGGLRYPLHRFLGTVFVGKTLKDLGVAYACSFGINFLPWFSEGFV